MPTFATFSPELPIDAPAAVLPVFHQGPGHYHTPSGLALGGPNTGSSWGIIMEPRRECRKGRHYLGITLPKPLVFIAKKHSCILMNPLDYFTDVLQT